MTPTYWAARATLEHRVCTDTGRHGRGAAAPRGHHYTPRSWRVGSWRGGGLGGRCAPHRTGFPVAPFAGHRGRAPFSAPPRGTVHAVLPHTAHRRSSPSAFGCGPPVPEGPGGDDGPEEAGETKTVTGSQEQGESEPAVPFAALGHEQGQPFHRMVVHLREHPGRVPVTEVPDPAAQEQVHLPHDAFNRHQQPGPDRELTEPVTGVLHRCRMRASGRGRRPGVSRCGPSRAPADGGSRGSRTPRLPPPGARSPVLASIGSSPSSASRTRSRASAASACCREAHITTRSST